MDLNKSIVCVSQKPTFEDLFSSQIIQEKTFDKQEFHQHLKNIVSIRTELFVRSYPLDTFDNDILRLCTRFIEILVMEEYRKWRDHRWPYMSEYVPQLSLSSILECHKVDWEEKFQMIFIDALASFQRVLNVALLDVDSQELAQKIVSQSQYGADFEQQKKTLKKELFAIHPDTGGDGQHVERIPEIKKRLNFLRNVQNSEWIQAKKSRLNNVDSFVSVIEGKSKVERRDMFRSLQKQCFVEDKGELYFTNLLKKESGKVNIEQEGSLIRLLYPYLAKHMTFLKNLFTDFTYNFEDVHEDIWKQPDFAQYAQELYKRDSRLNIVFGSVEKFQRCITIALYFYLHPKVGNYNQVFLDIANMTDVSDDILKYGEDLPLRILRYLKQQYSS